MWRGSPPFARPLPLAKGDTGVVPLHDPKSGAAAPTPVGCAQGRRANECAAPSTLRPAPACTQGQRMNGGAWKGQGTPPSWRTSQLGGGGTWSPPPCSCAGATCELQVVRAQKRPPPPFCACPLRSFTRAWERTRSRVRVGSGVRTPFAPAFAQNREGWGGAQTEQMVRWGEEGGGSRANGMKPQKWGGGALVYTRGARKRRAVQEWEKAHRPSPFACAPVRVEWGLRADRCHPTWVSVQAA
ncbi:hypothetical protein EDB86DRAFT_2837196 [Lactarius hatsudake]|nr:hypothetical protein EDB86DRAFT_2837196 [Lactarius hatsudake]